MKTYLCIALGGFLGAMGRFAIKNVSFFGIETWGIPLNTLLVNILGSFVLALFLALAAGHMKIPEHLRLGVSVGFLGAFTTFSTLAKELVKIHVQYGYANTFIYLTLSVAMGIGAVFAGMELGLQLGRKSKRTGGEVE